MILIDSEDAARAWVESKFAPTPGQWDQLDRFAAMLIAANSTQNLVSASTLPLMWSRHIADSAQLLCHDKRGGNGLWLDLGSGAGLPGLIAGILTDRPVWLVESRALRCQFLTDVVADLGLGDRVTVQLTRLERLATKPCATISARAFAPLPQLLSSSARFSTASTRWLLPKGRNADKELAMIAQPWQGLFHVEHSVTDADSGIIVGTGQVGGKR
jgi:16S rRNA (guanine527-N7)-methyltransferase